MLLILALLVPVTLEYRHGVLGFASIVLLLCACVCVEGGCGGGVVTALTLALQTCLQTPAVHVHRH